jgi:hypothetical protein
LWSISADLGYTPYAVLDSNFTAISWVAVGLVRLLADAAFFPPEKYML